MGGGGSKQAAAPADPTPVPYKTPGAAAANQAQRAEIEKRRTQRAAARNAQPTTAETTSPTTTDIKLG